MKTLKEIEVEIKIPLTPNFLIVNGIATPIEELDESILREISREWEEELIKKFKIKKGIIKK